MDRTQLRLVQKVLSYFVVLIFVDNKGVVDL